MKKQKIILGAVCVMSACLTSCGESTISYEEAIKKIESYDHEAAIATIETLSVEILGSEGTSESKMILQVDTKNPYIYTFSEDKGVKIESLLSSKDGKYTYTALGTSLEVTETYASTLTKTMLSSFAPVLFVEKGTISFATSADASIKSNGKNLLISFKGTFERKTGEIELSVNDFGLIEKFYSKVGDVKSSIKAVYNGSISKKTSL